MRGAPEAATLSPRRTSLGSTLETLGLTGGETEYSGPSRHVNRQLRHALLHQQPLSNRFDGSALASRRPRSTPTSGSMLVSTKRTRLHCMLSHEHVET